MNLPRPVTRFSAVFFSFVFAASAVADDYPTCKDDILILRDREQLILLAEQGYESAQTQVESFDRQIREFCLCKQIEWDRLKVEYIETLIAYTDGRSTLVRLAKPVVISQQRPECVAPTKRSWTKQKPVTEVDPIEN